MNELVNVFHKGRTMVNDMVDSVSRSMPGAPASAEQMSFLERMRSYLNPSNLKQTIITSKDTIIEMGLYIAIGFAIGFALKKYSKYVLVALLCIAGLVILQQFEFVSLSFNMAKVQEVFGFRSSQLDGDMMAVYWHWIKLNLTIVISFVIGLLLGLKIG